MADAYFFPKPVRTLFWLTFYLCDSEEMGLVVSPSKSTVGNRPSQVWRWVGRLWFLLWVLSPQSALVGCCRAWATPPLSPAVVCGALGLNCMFRTDQQFLFGGFSIVMYDFLKDWFGFWKSLRALLGKSTCFWMPNINLHSNTYFPMGREGLNPWTLNSSNICYQLHLLANLRVKYPSFPVAYYTIMWGMKRKAFLSFSYSTGTWGDPLKLNRGQAQEEPLLRTMHR